MDTEEVMAGAMAEEWDTEDHLWEVDITAVVVALEEVDTEEGLVDEEGEDVDCKMIESVPFSSYLMQQMTSEEERVGLLWNIPIARSLYTTRK
jgi:hypothetical protein